MNKRVKSQPIKPDALRHLLGGNDDDSGGYTDNVVIDEGQDRE